MTPVRKVIESEAVGVGVADTPKDLSAICRADCAAAIWRRQLPPDIHVWIDLLAPAQLPCARAILKPQALRDAVADICEEVGTPDGRERDWLVDDITMLSDIFAGLMRAPYLRLRLDVVSTNACRKFHIDAVTARLICTYRGTGTQYGFSSDGSEPRRVFTVPAGAPIILRGTLWPSDPPAGLLHRSPPIEGTGETRLMLVLDPIVDPEKEL